MKRFTIILTLFFTLLNCCSAAGVKTVTKDYKVVASDGFTISAKLEYPKIKNKKDFSTVILLHSLGYTSDWWQNLPSMLSDSGYAVLYIDFRGHGKSIYNSKLTRISWKNLKNRAFAKYPADVLSVIDYVKNDNKKTFFNNYVFVGSDIGAATAIITANKMEIKPKTIVMISPVIQSKSLYVPVNFAELGNVDVLSVTGGTDINGINANNYLKKFAQATYAEYTSESKSSGMLLLKNDESLANVITSWIQQYLKP